MMIFFRGACINGLRGDDWLKSARSSHSSTVGQNGKNSACCRSLAKLKVPWR